MEEEDVDGESTNAAACKKKSASSLHRSFMHLSRALKKLHARRRGHQASASVGGGDPPTTPSSSAAASFLSGCMHNPRTQSFASARRRRRHTHGEDDGEAGALAVNFRSLRIGPTEFAAAVAGDGGSSSSSPPPPPADRYSSDDERDGVVPPAPAAALGNNKAVVGGAGVAVVTFSAAPYEDFRRSMREMVDASADRGSALAAPAVDWEFMEELLFCYLHLNDRAVHRDILRAFTDTVAALRRRRRRGSAVAAKSRRARRRRWSAGADINGDSGAAQAVAPA
ncbi:unnamed protein product [Urochloa decumbens]|uniref:Transcription repressor n=1 Tax=Urochloa decumbens TaxID=240449 RepID=A0ABC9FIR2_9POAL